MIFSKIKILKHKLKNSELPILQVAYFLFFEKVVNNNGQQFMSKESLLRNIIGIILTPFLYLLIKKIISLFWTTLCLFHLL